MCVFFAKLLRSYLFREYGYYLEMVQDNEETAEYEILIGNVGISNTTVQAGEFIVSAADHKLRLFAADMQGYEALYNYITQTLLPSGNNADYTISEGFNETGRIMQTLEDGTMFASQNTGDVRCIFYNVYGWNDAGPKELRMQLQSELVSIYQPDVMALQEYSTFYHETFTPMLAEQGYEEVQVVSGDVINYTPLFYRKDRLEVLDAGYLLYSGPNDVDSKSVTWAVFEVMETGKKFIAMSTHFMYDQSGIDANAARISNAKEAVGLIEQIYANPEYRGIPLLIGGDMNCSVYSDPQKILQESGLQSAWNVAEVKNDNDGNHAYSIYEEAYEIYTSWSVSKGTYVSSIDHVYVTENAVVKAFATLLDMYAAISSDHSPELVDITLD